MGSRFPLEASAHHGRESMPARLGGGPHTVASQEAQNTDQNERQIQPPKSAPPNSHPPGWPWAPKAVFSKQHHQMGTPVYVQESVGHFNAICEKRKWLSW